MNQLMQVTSLSLRGLTEKFVVENMFVTEAILLSTPVGEVEEVAASLFHIHDYHGKAIKYCQDICNSLRVEGKSFRLIT